MISFLLAHSYFLSFLYWFKHADVSWLHNMCGFWWKCIENELLLAANFTQFAMYSKNISLRIHPDSDRPSIQFCGRMYGKTTNRWTVFPSAEKINKTVMASFSLPICAEYTLFQPLDVVLGTKHTRFSLAARLQKNLAGCRYL